MQARRLLFIIIGIKCLFMVAFILSGSISLAPDEAQYWTWSQQLDLGYYSKPPGIAWEIALGTALFGNTELGVRFGAVILAALLPIATFLWGRRIFPTEMAAWGGIALALSPLGFLSSLLTITDTGMALSWVMACYCLSRPGGPHFCWVGVWIALGALFKWPIFILWIPIICLRPFYKELQSKHLLLGLGISLLGLLPSLYWNATHDWATVRHVLATVLGKEIQSGSTSIPVQGNFFDFLAAQAGLMSPFLFCFFVGGIILSLRRIRKLSFTHSFCLATTGSLLMLGLTMALFKKMQGNWFSYIYPGAFLLSVWFCYEQKRWKPWLAPSIYLGGILALLALSIPTLQRHDIAIPYKLNAFRHNMGWKQLESLLLEVGYNPEKDFLFSDRYQTTSILSFYGPGQHRAYFLNLSGTRRNQFSYWPSLSEQQLENDGFFLYTENGPISDARISSYEEDLKKYFASVAFLGIRPLFFVGPIPVKQAILFHCERYNGLEPLDPSLF